MVKVFEGTENEYYVDGYLKTALDTAIEVIEEDWDMVFAVDGSEGSGKSVMAMQMGYYCDPTLTNDRIVFTPGAFKKAIMAAKPGQAVIYDEGYTGLNSRAAMTMVNRTLVNMLAEIRQRNLFVFIVMPCFFDLDKYAALWRTRALIHVYTGEKFKRGFFEFYNIDKKKSLYMLGKKYYSYSRPEPNFRGRFLKHYPVDEKEYKKNKRNSLIDREKKEEEAEKQREIEAMLLERVMALGDKVPHKIKMDLLSMPASTYFRKLKQYQEMREFS